MKSKNNERYTTYVNKEQLETLKELSEKTGESTNRLIGQALDDFLEDLDIGEERKYVPFDKDYISRKYKEERKDDGRSET